MQKINPGGPAEQAGLRGGSGGEVFQGAPFARGGDVITKIGDTPIENADDLSDAIARFKPGETADVEIHRGGKTQTVKVKLGERPLGNPVRAELSRRYRCEARAHVSVARRIWSGEHERAAATGAGLQPRARHLSGGRVGQARHRRPRDRVDRSRLPPRRDLDRVGDDRPGRRGRARARRQAVRGRGARGRLLPRALHRVRRRGLRPLLQHHRQPDALVHPALPLGPEQRAGHPPARGGGLQAGLPGRQRATWRRP